MQHGRSMLEMLGVLAIIGVLSLTSLYLYKHILIKNKLNNLIKEFEHIQLIVQDICFDNLSATCHLFWDAQKDKPRERKNRNERICNNLPGCKMSGKYFIIPNSNNETWTHSYTDNHTYRFISSRPKDQCKILVNTPWPNLGGLQIHDGKNYISESKPKGSLFTEEQLSKLNAACDRQNNGWHPVILWFYW